MIQSYFERIGDPPFLIHADPLLEDTAYPTHTLGLTEIGWPEFLMDPLSLGGEGNGAMINNAYFYFINKMDELRAILNWQTLKYPVNVISPRWQKAPIYTVCFRRVTVTFEAVKLGCPHCTLTGM